MKVGSRVLGMLVMAVLLILWVTTHPAYLSNVSYLATANSVAGLPRPLLDRMRVISFPLPSRDDLDALLPAVIADLARDRGLDASWIPPLDGDEHAAVASAWPGGSVRDLRRFVEVILRERDSNATIN